MSNVLHYVRGGGNCPGGYVWEECLDPHCVDGCRRPGWNVSVFNDGCHWGFLFSLNHSRSSMASIVQHWPRQQCYFRQRKRKMQREISQNESETQRKKSTTTALMHSIKNVGMKPSSKSSLWFQVHVQLQDSVVVLARLTAIRRHAMSTMLRVTFNKMTERYRTHL